MFVIGEYFISKLRREYSTVTGPCYLLLPFTSFLIISFDIQPVSTRHLYRIHAFRIINELCIYRNLSY